MAILSDYYLGDPRLNQYYLGSGTEATRFNQNYRPTTRFMSRGRGPESLYLNNMGVFFPTQMGDFTPSAGILGMDMPRLRFNPQIQPPREPVIVEDRVAQVNPNYRAMAALEDVAVQAEPAAAQAEPAMQGAAPQRTLGLLGDMFGGASALDEYMTPEQKAQLQNQGLMSAAMQLLASSGPSRTPVGLGQALGEAYGAGQKGYTAAQQNLLQSMAAKQKMDEYKRARDIEARISGALVGEGGAVAPGETITAEQAINAPGLPAGPTVARAAMIGAPGAAAPTSQADLLYNRYMNASNIAAQYGDTAKATAYATLADKARPTDKVIGEPFRADDGRVYQRTESGGVRLFGGGTVTPAAKPMGQPQQQLVDGKVKMIQYYDDGTFKPISGVSQVAKPTGQPQMRVVNGVPTMMQDYDDGTSKPLAGVSSYREPSSLVTNLEYVGGKSLANTGAAGLAELEKSQQASATKVSVDTGQKARNVPVNKDIIDRLSAKTEQAETANQTLANIDRILPALDKAITGPLADYRTTILRVGQFMGVAGKNADEILSNTQNVVQGLAQQELNAASYTKGQGTLTGPEREMLKRSAAGDQNMSAAELRTALVAAQKMAQFRLDDQAKFLEKTTRLPGMEEYRDLYTIDRYQPVAPAPAAGADGRKSLSDIIKPRGAR